MISISVEEAQAKLADLIATLAPGEEAAITRGDRTIARLVVEQFARPPRKPGNCKGSLVIIAEDDEHLSDWSEYLP